VEIAQCKGTDEVRIVDTAEFVILPRGTGNNENDHGLGMGVDMYVIQNSGNTSA